MFARDVAMPKTHEYVSPDGSLVLPAFRIWTQGPARIIWAGAGSTRCRRTAS
jgi:hypothetical protein